MNNTKEKIAYNVRLNDLWCWFRFEKFLVSFQSPNEEVVAKKVEEAFQRTKSKVNLICESFIEMHRDLIINANLNAASDVFAGTKQEILDENADNVSIVKRKQAFNARAQAEAERVAKQKKIEEDIATLETYLYEMTELINGITGKAAAYVSAYICKINKKNPDITNKLLNPFDSYEFDAKNYYIMIGGNSDV